MALSEKQKRIVEIGQKLGTFTITDLLGDSIIDTFYYNSRSNIGKILSNMVKKGYLKRLKKGTFSVNLSYRKTPKNVETQNEKLF